MGCRIVLRPGNLDAFTESLCFLLTFSMNLQAKLSEQELAALSNYLELPHASLQAELGANWWPRRGLGPMPPTDPVLYRLYEVRGP